MSEDVLPKAEGTRYLGPACDERGFVLKRKLPVGPARALAELAAEYAFFSPAILYLYGAFTDGPFVDLMFELNRDVALYHHRFRRPLFRGLEARSNGDPGWNYVLWAVRKDDWAFLRDYLVSLKFCHEEHRWVVRIGERPLLIVDPLVADRGQLLPGGGVEVTAFGIYTNKFCCGLVDHEKLARPPVLTIGPAHPELAVWAEARFAGGNPDVAVLQHKALAAQRETQREKRREEG
jgi:hypothetical protein